MNVPPHPRIERVQEDSDSFKRQEVTCGSGRMATWLPLRG